MSEVRSDTLTILAQAKALVEKGWCRGDWARTEAGVSVAYYDQFACQFCSSGAIRRVILDLQRNDTHSASIALAVFKKAIGTNQHTISTWNDSPNRTKVEVLETFDKAIELAKDHPL
jgi:hypothetical protein